MFGVYTPRPTRGRQILTGGQISKAVWPSTCRQLKQIVVLIFKPVFRPRDRQNRTPRPSNIITNCLLDRFSWSESSNRRNYDKQIAFFCYMSTPRSSKPSSFELFLTNLHSRPSQALGPPQIDAPWKVRPKHGIEIEYGCTEGPTIPKHWSELRNLNLFSCSPACRNVPSVPRISICSSYFLPNVGKQCSLCIFLSAGELPRRGEKRQIFTCFYCFYWFSLI